MRTPDWWQLALLALAAFRTWKLLAEDVILDRPREEALFRIADVRRREYWKDFLICPWCAGFWLSLAWWGFWQAWPQGALVAATPWAISAVVGLVAKLAD